jgi:hypothetical protein
MGKWKGLINLRRYVESLCAKVWEVGIRACRTQSFHITIVTKLVSKWHRLRHCMDDSVEHPCSKVRLERVKYLVQKY